MTPFKKKPCTWNGVAYESINAAAEENYISSSGMLSRLRKGNTCDDDVKIQGGSHECTWNNIMYGSKTAAARANNISANTMCNRLSQGYTCDEDMKNQHDR